MLFTSIEPDDQLEIGDEPTVLTKNVRLIAAAVLTLAGAGLWLGGLQTASATAIAAGLVLVAVEEPDATERKMIVLTFTPMLAGQGLLAVGYAIPGWVAIAIGVAMAGVYLYTEWRMDPPPMPDPDAPGK
jgi:hypothetical protein